MRLKFYYGKRKTNKHGTQEKDAPWNKETVKGWKLRFLDLKKANAYLRREDMVVFEWRFILYFPSGAWHHFDIVLKQELNDRCDAKGQP